MSPQGRTRIGPAAWKAAKQGHPLLNFRPKATTMVSLASAIVSSRTHLSRLVNDRPTSLKRKLRGAPVDNAFHFPMR